MTDTISIPRRFCGPPDSANGGYACGVVAAFVGNPAEVTLRRPPPLETPMRVDPDDGSVAVYLGDDLVAEAVVVDEVGVEPAPPVDFDDAAVATTRSWISLGQQVHPFPTCFTCGPGRESGDGQRVFVGPVAGRDVAAAPWMPDESLAAADGRVAPEIVWAVLDCAGGIGCAYRDGEYEAWPPHVLGRFIADIVMTPAVGERCVALGWRIAHDGRKMFAGSALYGEDSGLLGFARATWIELRS